MIAKKQYALPMEEYHIAWDIYSKEQLAVKCEDDELEANDAGFMLGYLD